VLADTAAGLPVPRVVFDEVNVTLPMAFLSPGVTPDMQRLQLVTAYVDLLLNFQNTCGRLCVRPVAETICHLFWLAPRRLQLSPEDVLANVAWSYIADQVNNTIFGYSTNILSNCSMVLEIASDVLAGEITALTEAEITKTVSGIAALADVRSLWCDAVPRCGSCPTSTSRCCLP
jgi:hypothetical protein